MEETTSKKRPQCSRNVDHHICIGYNSTRKGKNMLGKAKTDSKLFFKICLGYRQKAKTKCTKNIGMQGYFTMNESLTSNYINFAELF